MTWNLFLSNINQSNMNSRKIYKSTESGGDVCGRDY